MFVTLRLINSVPKSELHLITRVYGRCITLPAELEEVTTCTCIISLEVNCACTYFSCSKKPHGYYSQV